MAAFLSRPPRALDGSLPDGSIAVCLLIAIHRTHPDAPLVVAANRDEMIGRPAAAMTILREADPRILGGRDHLAGGTWLALSADGLFAALTNRPSSSRDPSKRSRGEWPIFLAGHESARDAADAFVESHRPSDYNPGWVFVGDGEELLYIDMTGGTRDRGRLMALGPGIHILENRPLEAPSAKADLVRAKLEGIEELRGAALVERLGAILASHDRPEPRGRVKPESGGFAPEPPSRPPGSLAACVHLGKYGTRSSTIVLAVPGRRPRLWSADGPPCTVKFSDAADLWQSEARVSQGGAGA